MHIAPGVYGDTFTVTAASPTRAVQITAQGSCTRCLALPVLALRAALKRDRAAEHVAVVEGGGGLVSVRTFQPPRMNEAPRTVPGQALTGVTEPKAQQLWIDDLLRPVRQAFQLTTTCQLNFDDIELLRHITDEPSMNMWQSLRLRSWFLCLQGSICAEISNALACNAPKPQRS